VNGQSGREWLGYQSRPATVLMILAAALVAMAWSYSLATSRTPEPQRWEPQTSGEPVQVTVP
jgi:hypothetical protein